ncbi:MAG: hypothetical protein Q8941_05295 [Bacteroidota bacterium]|nr:hypothetical protein [Bacteroidota bacterium]
MLLVTGPIPEFLKFIQILCWIVLPVLAFIVLVTVLLHYGKKRKDTLKDNSKENESDLFMQASPEQVGYTNGDGEYILFDYSDLIRAYKDRLTYSHARVTALQRNLTNIQTKYTVLANYIQTHFINSPKKDAMENVKEKVPGDLQAEINKLVKDHEEEKKELLVKLEQFERSFRRLEQENRALQEQVSMETATDDEKAVVINRWKEENNSLREKVAGQEYLEDLLQEKKAQIHFLQNQLEQRIKDLYRSEHQRLQAVAETKRIKEDNDTVKKNKEALENELLLRQEQADKIQVVLCEREEQLAEKQLQLNDKLNYIAYLENTLREAKEQNETLSAAMADNRDLANTLEQQLSEEQAKVQFMVQKLFDNKQLLRRLYKELSNFIDDESKGSLVIALRPEYNNRENEETVV